MYFYLQKENNWLGVKYFCPPSLGARQQRSGRRLSWLSCCMEVEAGRGPTLLELTASTGPWLGRTEVGQTWRGRCSPP